MHGELLTSTQSIVNFLNRKLDPLFYQIDDIFQMSNPKKLEGLNLNRIDKVKQSNKKNFKYSLDRIKAIKYELIITI